MSGSKTISGNKGGVRVSDFRAVPAVAREKARGGTSRMATVPELMERGLQEVTRGKLLMLANPARVHYEKGLSYLNPVSNSVRHTYSESKLEGLPWYGKVKVLDDIPSDAKVVLVTVVCGLDGKPVELAVGKVTNKEEDYWVAMVDTPNGGASGFGDETGTALRTKGNPGETEGIQHVAPGPSDTAGLARKKE